MVRGRRLRQLRKNFADRLKAKVATLSEADAGELVLTLLKKDLSIEVQRRVEEHLDGIVAAFENWWDKYRVTLRDVESSRSELGGLLNAFLHELGYA